MYKRSFMFLSMVSLLLLGCEQEGPMEKAGKQIDESVETVKEKAQDVMNDQGPAERAGEKIDETIENIQERSTELRDRVQKNIMRDNGS